MSDQRPQQTDQTQQTDESEQTDQTEQAEQTQQAEPALSLRDQLISGPVPTQQTTALAGPSPASPSPASPSGTTSRRGVLRLAAVGLASVAVGGGVWAWRNSHSPAEADDAAQPAQTSAGFLAETQLHTVEMTVDPAVLTAMLAEYNSTENKEWIEVGLVIDGASYDRVGARLKGNSSLRQVSTDSTAESLPWLIRLDEFVSGQTHHQLSEFVIRSNNSQTALNEAVALDLLAAAGLASQRAAYLSFTANGSDPVLRLAVENPADAFVARVFAGEQGVLYKAEAGGDYSYRGDAASDYTDIFDQESGGTDNYAPLAAFLKFLDESSDAGFAAGLADHLDVAAFATYLAFQDLIANSDDIDGPGNNSYLWWEQSSDQMTVVAWDHNLAFGGMGGMGGGGMGGGGMGAGAGRARNGGMGAGQRPSTDPSSTPEQPPTDGSDRPSGAQAGAPGGGGFGGRSNLLVTRFTAIAAQQSAVTTATASLKSSLFASGIGQQRLQARVAVVVSSGLVEQASIDSESSTIAGYFTS